MTNLEKIQEIINGDDKDVRNRLLLNFPSEFCYFACLNKTKFRCKEKCEGMVSEWLLKDCDIESKFWENIIQE